MRYLARVCVAWLREVFQSPLHQLVYKESSSIKWQSACYLINIVDPKRLTQLVVPEAVRDASTFSSLGGHPRITLRTAARAIAWILTPLVRLTMRARVMVCPSEQ